MQGYNCIIIYNKEKNHALQQAAGAFSSKGRRCHFLNAADHVKPSRHDCIHLDPDQHHRLAEVLYEKIHKDITTSGLY